MARHDINEIETGSKYWTRSFNCTVLGKVTNVNKEKNRVEIEIIKANSGLPIHTIGSRIEIFIHQVITKVRG